ncbi:Uncharacterised protein [uncultured archaeon]|nr:Uncharacterised protein [uncultured archaeon]
MGRPLNRQKYFEVTAPHQIQATIWGANDTGSTAGYLSGQNSSHRFKATTANGTSIATLVNGSGNLVSGTSFVEVFPEGSYPTLSATGTAALKALNATVIVNGGRNYAVGNYLNLTGGTYTNAANVSVTAVNASNGNAVTAVSAPVAGTQGYTVLPANVADIAMTTVTGNGTGATIGFNFGVESANITFGGAGYTNANVVVEGATVAPTFANPTVTGGVVSTGAVVVTSPGVVNVNPVIDVEDMSGATEYVNTISSKYVVTYQGNVYRWLPKGAEIPSDYDSLGVKLAYLDTL